MEAGDVSRRREVLASRTSGFAEERENIRWKVAQRLRVRAGVESGIAIRLIKRIPAAAGPGGTSCDVAGELVAANQVWPLGWLLSDWAEIAAQQRSDIPILNVAPQTDGSAVCRGRWWELRAGTAIPSRVASLFTSSEYGRHRPERLRRVDDTHHLEGTAA
jgi:4-diphosphocytidyl-2-C-methyl-D-erythritol kinase